MAFTHRDHRARRELRQLYVMFGAAIIVLTAVAILAPGTVFRILGVVGLILAGVAYLVAVDRLTGSYRQDLAAAQSGGEMPGMIRAEVYHEVGFERDRDTDWRPSPHQRRPEAESDADLPADARESTEPVRSDPR